MNKQNIKNTKLKGTVLFTVVSVMMVLIVFVMATLTIASAASKRSYNTYFKNQSLYSARSVVDTTVNELLDGDATNTLKNEATKLSAGDILELSCDLPAGMGTVTDLKVEYVGVDGIGTPTFVAGSGDGIVRVTATVEMSGQASTYSQYVLKSAVVTTPAISEGGLVSMGKGMQDDATSPKIYGSTYTFNTNDSGDVKNSWSELRNEGSVNALSYNSSANISTQFKLNFDKGEGIYIAGHLLNDNLPVFRSNVGKDDNLMYSEIPYIYVGGVFFSKNSAIEIGERTAPINIYCGSMNGSDGMRYLTTYGDIYAYDKYINDSYTEDIKGTKRITGLTELGGGHPQNDLLKWVDGLVNKTDGNFSSHTGGSFYSNGKLIINSNSQFEGDVIVKGPVQINTTNTGTVSINGSLYAGESLTITTGENGTNEFTVGGGIFVGTGATVSIAKDVTINGEKCNTAISKAVYSVNDTTSDLAKYIAAVNAAAAKEAEVNATQDKVTATQEKIDNGKLFPKTMDKDYLIGEVVVDNSDMLESFKATVNGITEYKDYKAKPEDAGDSYSRVYTSADKDFTKDIITKDTKDETTGDTITTVISGPLTENCTLYGTWSEDIYIKPGNDTMWITLANFNFASGKNIIVENTGTVYFFVPEKGAVYYDASEQKLVDVSDGNVEITGNLTLDGNKIITSYYNDLNESINLTKYPIDKAQVPNIYIYMAGGKVASEAPPRLVSTNQSIITGFICAPYITLEFWNARGVGGAGASITYDDDENPVDKAQVAVIGQVIVGEIDKFTNSNIVLQVSPNAAGGGGSEEGSTTGGKWTPIENAYGFGG